MKQKCVILVPVSNQIEPECETSLRRLTSNGYEVRRVWGYSDISRGRSQMATDALADGFEEILWIDSDIAFNPDMVEKLRSHNLPIVGGIYPVKNERRLACATLQQKPVITFGEGGGLFPLKHLATGFMLTQSKVYQDIERQFQLPRCYTGKPNGMIPYFMSMITKHDTLPELIYLSEGFSFCERARQCGHEILADTTIRLGHIGKTSFYWEEAGKEPTRYKTFRYQIS